MIRVAIFEIANTQPEYLLLFIRAELPHLQIQINGRESECTVLGLVVSSCGKPCPTVKIPCISLNVHLQTICRKCVTNVHTEQVSARAILRFNFYKPLTIGPGNYICFAKRSVHTPHPAVCSVFSTKRPPVSFTWNRAVRTCAISACGIVCREVIVARAVPRVPSCGITYSISLVMNTALQGIGRSCRTRILHPFMKIPL